MTTMQRNCLKKTLAVLGAITYGIVAIVFAALSDVLYWAPWVSIAMTGLVAVPIAFAIIYVPIATAVWHWRLMGICEEEWQSKLLSSWWFWMYRNENWFCYLQEDITYNFSNDEKAKQKATDFLYALARVKKPKLL